MDNRRIQWLKQVSDIVRPYILRKGDGLRYAANLAIFYITLQGIRLVSSWVKFEIIFPGVDTVPGAIVVCVVCLALILAHCYLARFMPTQSELFREVLRLRELGFTLHEIEEKQVAYRLWVANLYASAEQHSVPVPVKKWSDGKLRELIGSVEFAEMVGRSLPTLQNAEAYTGMLLVKWISEPSFKNSLETTSDLIAWIANQIQGP